MKKSTLAVVAAGAAAAIAVPVLYRQNTTLQATEYVYCSAKVTPDLEGYRITQVSDLHGAKFGKGNCLLLALLEGQRPDMVAITGDLMCSYADRIASALEFAKQVTKIAPCYFVTGNHEHRMERSALKHFLSALEDSGIRVLQNEAITLNVGASAMGLIGVNCYQGRMQKLLDLMAEQDKGRLNILLSHMPQYAENYEKAGVDLVFSGHAHGGQFRLPVIGGLYAPGQGLLPKYTAGMYRLGNTVMAVSRGLGNSSFPIRLGNPPELVTVTLQHTEK